MPETRPPLALLSQRLDELLRKAIAERIFPGAVAAIAVGPPDRRRELLVRGGYLTYPQTTAGRLSNPDPMTAEVFFDLASLTKPLATTLAVFSLIETGQLSLAMTLPELLQRPLRGLHRTITLRHLLAHAAGLPAHRPYFQALEKVARAARPATLLSWILAEELLAPPGQAALYSDLGFLLLGWIVELQAAAPLDRYVGERIFHPLQLAEHLFYRPWPAAEETAKIFAPTEFCPWRQTLLAGVVHDDNCYSLGGVAGHAGLFGDLAGVLKIGEHLLDLWHGRPGYSDPLPPELRQALGREGSVAGSSWGLGFDTPSLTGSSAGHFLAPESFGHLGFTGTSLWIDPSKELVMVLLSNRVHPTRDNPRIRQFRPLFHDTVVRSLGLAVGASL